MNLSFQACRYGHVQHLEHLLFYGADMSAQNASGNTALHVCALYNQVPVINKMHYGLCVGGVEVCQFSVELHSHWTVVHYIVYCGHLK